MLAKLSVGLVVSVLVTSAAPPAHSTGADAGDLSPDLKALKASDLSLEFLGGDVRRLRFTTEVANMKTGPLELQPVADDCNGNGDFSDDRTAMQRIYHDDDSNGYFTRDTDLAGGSSGRGASTTTTSTTTGTSRTSRATGCTSSTRTEAWAPRFERARRSASASGICSARSARLGARRGLATTGPTAARTAIRGISVGWADRYPAALDGQHIDVTGVPDGDYCLVLVTDPIDRLMESNELNNATGIRITLTADSVEWLPYRAC